ncbi:MAG: tRNA pseudouridine(55) synthase TruB [Chlorobium sp.]|uniref:tRNA pseudouridine(55) synthase TruB n=1 Tax=Chlorobium sp. TaxID=1095 RepID=UPI0025BCE932|nr:tRNA pseudouridine(55) synthase TruB [Chlorobium sp.]MCF8382597.1 tRNA pseudouridine(55) synthase TruB [Chlorobium sp.]
MQEQGIEQVCCDDGVFLLVDKPVDWTSFDVVAKVRNAYGKCGLKRKVGHCGTLDPKASGLLILATGRKTREISSLEVLDKVYEGSIRLGALTESHDTETSEYGHCDTGHLTSLQIRDTAASFIGPSLQQPPMHSAVWHNGRRLYEFARKGHVVRERREREIMVHRFEITAIELPHVFFVLEVSKGAYIRVIAHEFGRALGVGGYLASLRRTAIGSYDISVSRSVQETVDTIISGCSLSSGQRS